MEYTIDFESVDRKTLTKIFYSQLSKNIYMLEDSCDYESFLQTTVKDTVHILEMKEKLGKSTRVKEDEYVFCIFCNDLIKQNEFKRKLPCGHEFHKKCIDKWIFKYLANKCPCCLTII